MIKVQAQMPQEDAQLRSISPQSCLTSTARSVAFINRVDDSWERLSATGLGSVPGTIVAREPETGLIEALRRPGLLKLPSRSDSDLTVPSDVQFRNEPEESTMNLWDVLVGTSMKLPAVLASNIVLLAVGFLLGRRSVSLEGCAAAVL